MHGFLKMFFNITLPLQLDPNGVSQTFTNTIWWGTFSHTSKRPGTSNTSTRDWYITHDPLDYHHPI